VKWSVQRVALTAVAVLATFGIGVFAGREIFRAPARPQDQAWSYDLDQFSRVPSDLERYRLELRIPVDLAEPRGLASQPDGTVLVCGDRALLAVDRGGAVLARYPLEGEPTCVSVGGDGRIYLGLGDHVEVIEPASEETARPRGAPRAWSDLGPQAIVTSIAAAGANVFVADAGNRAVLRFDTGGKLLGRIDGDWVVPSPYFDLAAQPDGTLWVANPGRHLLLHFTSEGRLLGSWGGESTAPEGFLGCCNPVHIALLPCGSLVTSEKGILRVKVFESEGRLTGVAALPADFSATERSVDLATRKANGGEILVLVPGERAVRVYCK
jgi:hypothetical protein